MRCIALLFCLLFIGASGEPEPNVNVNINVNINGESEKSVESGISCSLVWNHEEYRPLIMIRESKTIVPPIIDKDISNNPNRIPLGIKLIFACPGEKNQFNHVNGTHTKLHGECTGHEQFKVCVNNFPEFLNLSQLSCSSKMFPSFIKDNDTSYKKSCDGIGGELYKTGYTYGDYHEFKDLEIEVCFREKNMITLCTSPNLNGNETDYRTSRGFLRGPIEEPPGKNLRGGIVSTCGIAPRLARTVNGKECIAIPERKITAECRTKHGETETDHPWCYYGNEDDDWDYCYGLDYKRKYVTLNNGEGRECIRFQNIEGYCDEHGQIGSGEWCYINGPNGQRERRDCGGQCPFGTIQHERFKNQHLCPKCNNHKDAALWCHNHRGQDKGATVLKIIEGPYFRIDWAPRNNNKIERICRILQSVRAWSCRRDTKEHKLTYTDDEGIVRTIRIYWRCNTTELMCTGAGYWMDGNGNGHLVSDEIPKTCN